MERTEVKQIVGVNRQRRLSRNANPRYLVTFSDGTSAMTGVDCSVNYAVPNSDMHGVDLVCTFRDGLLVDAYRVKPDPRPAVIVPTREEV